MKKKSKNSQKRKLNAEQRQLSQILMLLLTVVILIIIIRIAERPKEPEAETIPEPPTVVIPEQGMTVPVGMDGWGDRLPEEPGDEPDETEATEPESEEEPEGEDEFETSRFRRNGVPEVLALIESYFRARTEGDAVAMNQIYGITEVGEQELKEQSTRMRNNSKYVQNFENVVTYVMDGATEGSWIVYAVADINFYLSKTRAPMIFWCYVVQDGEGSCRIMNTQEFTPEIQRLIEEAGHSEEVRNLAANVNQRLREALNGDEKLKQVYGVLRDGSPVWGEEEETRPEVSIIGAGGESVPEEN